ncbi:MAG: hypothetical protein UY64_C0012G0016 [Parcubacteria group bacterium GW2011_GWA1_51_12]|nr:MAG: hypothetical protein UY64_C0012G0016 [Parcubacteria group bacterium GW2011_GWA1_51_12]
MGPQPVVPTEYDTVHTEANRPKLFVAAPLPGDVVKNGEPVVVRLSFQTAFRAKELDVIWDDEVRKTLLSPASPLELFFAIKNGDGSGEAILKVRLVDEVGNKSEVAIPLLVTP